MKAKDFDELVSQRLGVISDTLKFKGKEYGRNSDHLHNFHAAARINSCTPEQALWGMLTKHLVSVQDIVNESNGGMVPSVAYVNEKIGDCINYLILLEAIIAEQR